jgi:PTH2 family peptidyl-tRNA hydrolase
MPSKQVLVMRKFDKGCRTGKYCAQAGHASVGAIFSLGKVEGDEFVISLVNPFVKEWVTGRFTKITLYVESEEELKELYQQALSVNIPTALIMDAGLTEFKGIPTLTAVGIGPDDIEKIDKLTKHLPLF